MPYAPALTAALACGPLPFLPCSPHLTPGEKTGRSPKDKRVTRDPETEKDLWWGKCSPNYIMDNK